MIRLDEITSNYIYLCCIFFIVNNVFTQSNNLPLEDDLENYIESLKSVTSFYEKHSNVIDISALFGLFIINVNFNHIFKNNKGLSATTLEDMEYISQTNEKTIKNFIMIANKTFPKPYPAIATLFANCTLWVNHLNQFTHTPKKRYSKNDLEAKYANWETYKKEVKSQIGVPDQYMSNECLASLAEYPINTRKRILICPLEEPCNAALKSGTDLGYSLSHRIIWLVSARYGRGCNILSSREDKQLMEKFCGMALAEIEYNVINNYELADLMFEFICICALGGHSEYLQKDWLETMLDFQTISGCFQVPSQGNLFGSPPGDDGICNHHTTSLSVCSISAAVRYILEKYSF